MADTLDPCDGTSRVQGHTEIEVPDFQSKRRFRTLDQAVKEARRDGYAPERVDQLLIDTGAEKYLTVGIICGRKTGGDAAIFPTNRIGTIGYFFSPCTVRDFYYRQS